MGSSEADSLSGSPSIFISWHRAWHMTDVLRELLPAVSHSSCSLSLLSQMHSGQHFPKLALYQGNQFVVVVQSLCLTLCDPMDWQHASLLRFTSIESVMLSNHLILCCRWLLLPLIFLSIRIFSSELGSSHQWPKYWSSSINPFNESSRLISFRIDWKGNQWLLHF